MNILEIKSAVDAGQTVCWSNEGYVVCKDALGQYLITYQPNGSTIGLTNRTGDRLNGEEGAFFISRSDLGVTMQCSDCGGVDVQHDCWASWNVELQVWETADLKDHAFCNTCDADAKLTERPVRDYRGYHQPHEG